jgi:hypothetical protein
METDRQTRANFSEAVNRLPNDREHILNAAEDLAVKAKNAGVPPDDFKSRITAPWGAEYSGSGR